MESDMTENEFLEQLERANPDIGAMTDAISGLQKAGRRERAREWTELLLEALGERKQVEAALDVLTAYAGGIPDGSEGAAELAGHMESILGSGPEVRVMLNHSGMESGVPLFEAISRFRLLRSLQPGVFCQDKTWGFGVVAGIDLLYGKIIIDFEERDEHEMMLSYAAETLEILDEQHIKVRQHTGPESIMEMVKSDPAELVRMAIRSYGPMTVTQLQERLIPGIVNEGEWKRFWDAARKNLKSDPAFRVPSRRNDQLEIIDPEGLFGDAWFDQLSSEKDMRRILEHLDELSESLKTIRGDGSATTAASHSADIQAGGDRPKISNEGLTDAHRQTIADRLAFVVKGAGMKRADLAAQAVIKADEYGVMADGSELRSCAEKFLKKEHFLATVSLLSARDTRRFIRFLIGIQHERALALLVESVPDLEITSLNECLAALQEFGRDTDCAELFRESLKNRNAGVEMLSWLSRNMDRVSKWSLPDRQEIMEQILISLESDFTGERLKAQNQLRDRFNQNDWLADMLAGMSEVQRRAFFKRLKDSIAWPPMEKRSVLGRIIKIYPELEELMKSDSGATPVKQKGPMTSQRSYIERQRQLEKIKTVDIPQNSREIAVARSYGDLRENHEYKAAKETQGLLMRRMGELDDMLNKVVATDFEGIKPYKAGVGTGVTLEYPNGKRERYYILGIWDRNERLGIISSESRMAAMLEGYAEGDEVVVPAEHGDVRCRIAKVEGLSPEVREWIRSDPQEDDA